MSRENVAKIRQDTQQKPCNSLKRRGLLGKCGLATVGGTDKAPVHVLTRSSVTLFLVADDSVPTQDASRLFTMIYMDISSAEDAAREDMDATHGSRVE